MRDHWLPLVLPFLVYMAIGLFEPSPPGSAAAPNTAEQPGSSSWSVPYRYYPVFYAVRLTLTLLAVAGCARAYRAYPWRISWMAILIGLVGAVVWIGLCRLRLESTLASTSWFQSLGLAKLFTSGSGTRVAFDPFTQLGESRFGLGLFLAIRFVGLVCVVPLIEEFFLRGFLMRFVAAAEWWKLPVGQLTRGAVGAMLVYGVVTHPGELIAAVCWFSMVTWLVARTQSVWDGVIAHGVTNLLLGLYVITTRDWSLW